MKRKTQVETIRAILDQYGEVGRNHALSLGITRLGAIMCGPIYQKGYAYEGEWRGSDYFYVLSSAPAKPKPKTYHIKDPLTGELLAVH